MKGEGGEAHSYSSGRHVTRAEAEADPDNLPSHRILERCGYRPTGVMGAEGPRFWYEG